MRLWPVKRSDPLVCALADRHYSRQKRGCRSVGSNCRLLVLRDVDGLVAFVYGYPKDGYRRDGQNGVNCELFRNESSERASSLIVAAEELVLLKWPEARRFYTYVDGSRVASANPGFCFICAGYRRVGLSKTGKVLLVRDL